MNRQVKKHPVLTLAKELELGEDIRLYRVDVTDGELELHIGNKILQVRKDDFSKKYIINPLNDMGFYIRRDTNHGRTYTIELPIDETCGNHNPNIDMDKIPEDIAEDFEQLFTLMFHYETYEFKKNNMDFELIFFTPTRVYFRHEIDPMDWDGLDSTYHKDLYYDVPTQTCNLTFGQPDEFFTIIKEGLLTLDNVDEVCQRLQSTKQLYLTYLKDRAKYIQQQLFTFAS